MIQLHPTPPLPQRQPGAHGRQALFRLMDCYFVNFVPSELKPPNTFKDAIAEFLGFSRAKR